MRPRRLEGRSRAAPHGPSCAAAQSKADEAHDEEQGQVRLMRKTTPALFGSLKKALPEPIRSLLRRAAHWLRSKAPSQFKPYLKFKNVEGVKFDFWICGNDARSWYDLQCTDPEWVEMRFVRDRLIEPGDVVFECGGHHGCTAILCLTGSEPAARSSPSRRRRRIALLLVEIFDRTRYAT